MYFIFKKEDSKKEGFQDNINKKSIISPQNNQLIMRTPNN